MNTLRLDKILDFYDEPQLLTARDKFGAQYICLLYDDDSACRYTAVRISDERLRQLLSGNVDLRAVFTNPEAPAEYFDVVYDNNELKIENLGMSRLPESRLPEEGYKAEADANETLTVHLPVRDHGLFTELVRKFGWACM